MLSSLSLLATLLVQVIGMILDSKIY